MRVGFLVRCNLSEAVPEVEIAGLADIALSAAVRATACVLVWVKDKQAVVRRRRLVVVLVLRRVIAVVNSRFLREDSLVEYLEVARVEVVVVHSGVLADLHLHENIIRIAELPSGAGQCLNER